MGLRYGLEVSRTPTLPQGRLANESLSYALQWLVVLPLEIMAASMTFDYWNVQIPKAASITVFLLAITAINLHGVKAYGESETLFSILKVVAVIGFMFVTWPIYLRSSLADHSVQHSWSNH